MIDRKTASGLRTGHARAADHHRHDGRRVRGAPGRRRLSSTPPVERAGRAHPSLQGRHGSCAQAAGGSSHGAIGDVARRACSTAFGDVASRAPPGMPA